MATRTKNKKKHERRRQQDRSGGERGLWRALLLRLAWIVIGLVGIGLWLRDPQGGYWVIGVWLLLSILWGAHVALRWLFRFLGSRSAHHS